MTAGLLISRQNKNALFKLQLAENTPANVNKYKIFKQTYFKTVRAAKKLYFQRKFQENTGNSKKTWDTLNEALGKSKKAQSVDKININGVSSSDPKEIANHFNRFFTQVGKNISSSIPRSKTTRGLHSL